MTMVDAKFAIPKLNGHNWQTWKVKLEMLLCREDIWYVVTEEIPDEADRNAIWKSADRKAKATIVLLLEDSQLAIVKNSVHARDAYEALKSYHQKTTRSVRVSLLKRLCSFNLAEGGNVEQHLMEIDDLFDRLDAAGTELDKDTKICMLLRSLPASFDHLVSALDSRSDDDISIDFVKAKLTDEYHRRIEREGGNSGKSKIEKAMRSSENKQKETRICHFCKRQGHLRRNCRKFQAANKEGGQSVPATDRNGGGVKAKAAHSETRNVAFTVDDGENFLWIIDSGASAHMTNDRAFFTSLKEFDGGWITLADGKRTQVLGEGSGVLFGIDGQDEIVTINMSDVKFVPGLSTSLVSVGKLAQKSLKVCFDENGCKIIDANKDVVATGLRYGGLYHLKLAGVSMKVSADHHNQNCQHQWHRRMGHRNWAALERINKEQLGSGMKINDCGIKQVCKCCLEGKAARSPFPAILERKSSQILDIVHTDLCGPMKTHTPSGNKYVMNLVDDFSRFTVTYLLRNKWEATERIKEYVRWVENLFGRKPRVIRSDGGGEYDNHELRNFYKVEGIKPQFTVPYSPQQNGVAERKNRSLTEMATCMLLDANMDKRYWGEAVLTATYLQNRLPTRSVQKTPYELWWGRKPELGHLRVFGSEAYVHIPSVKRSKIESKARKLKLVGYSSEHKGYRFVDPATDVITVSRDAKFLELDNEASLVEMPAVVSEPAHVEEVPIEKLEIEENNIYGNEGEDSEHDEFHEASDQGNEATGELRRSRRPNSGNPPRYLEDYVLEEAVGFAASAYEEPNNYKEAMMESKWRNAMIDELESHRRNGTWELVERPPGRKIVGAKWVLKIKRNEKDEIVKHKARLVAQGCIQKPGIDFEEVYAPVARIATLRTFLVVAAKRSMPVYHFDVKTAYLYGVLDEEIFMRQPPGFEVPGNEELVCKLKRSIYGLRQSARCWNRKLKQVLTKLGFTASIADPCLFVKGADQYQSFLLVYVDDFLIAATENEMKNISKGLQEEFELTSLGEVSHFLGMEVKREAGFFNICLRNYINKLLEKHGMEQAKTSKSPMDPTYLKSVGVGEAFEDVTKYRSLVGGLLYLSVLARPDIAACTAILGRRFNAPTQGDWSAAKRMLRYLKLTKDWCLRLGGDTDTPLIGYSDADWAGDPESRRSTSGFVFSFGGGVISWASRRQSSVTLSSMEAEFVALSETCQEGIWLRDLLRDFGEKQLHPTLVYEDNQSCLAFVRTERCNRRSKHIDTREHFVRELCERKQIELKYCPTELMLADVLTKPLGPQKHERFCQMLGLLNNE